MAPTESRTQVHLASHRYGKSRVRLLRVTRYAAHHDLDDWTVEVLLTGDFAEVFTHGDNRQIIATDTMKNTVYYLARQSKADSMETFAQELIDFLLSRNPQVTAAEVRIESHLWKRLTIEGEPYPTAFMKGSDERQTTHVTRAQDGAFQVRSGFDHMTLLKTAQSSFVGFLRDELTTLPEASDRLLGTSVTAEWQYAPKRLAAGIAFMEVRQAVREHMLTTFARHDSLSVQQTLYAMAEDALNTSVEIDEVFLRMPNKHNLQVDLSRFGADNPNHIFVPTDEPHGTIEATVRRS
jgi:urate oxidase